MFDGTNRRDLQDIIDVLGGNSPAHERSQGGFVFTQRGGDGVTFGLGGPSHAFQYTTRTQDFPGQAQRGSH